MPFVYQERRLLPSASGSMGAVRARGGLQRHPALNLREHRAVDHDLRRDERERRRVGQKRRVDIARALLSQPDILFLDEPTTGLDIQTRKSIWDLLYQLQKEEGMTVVLTTHYLDEADEADQIYIVDHGKVIAQGSALDIKSQYAKNILKIRFKEIEQIESLKNSGMSVEQQGSLEYVFQPKSEREAIDYLAQVRDRIAHFEFRPGTMDDAFIALTGREVR